MHRYTPRPVYYGGEPFRRLPNLHRRSLLRRIARPAFQFAAALAVVAAYLALCAALEG